MFITYEDRVRADVRMSYDTQVRSTNWFLVTMEPSKDVRQFDRNIDV